MGSINPIRRELQELITLLRTHHIDDIADLSPLEKTANNWQQGNSFHVDNLTFRFSASSQNPMPKVETISVSISLTYVYGEEIENHDVFQNYQLDICLTGYPKNEKEMSKFFFWHLDKEIATEGHFIHPLYHFHAGGRRMEDKIDEDSTDFILSSPRLPHPPMDITLAIHFILQNFLYGKIDEGKKKNKVIREIEMKSGLMNDESYKLLLEKARERILDPYFLTFHPTSTHQDYKKTNLFPLYL
mgnify:CR=1 FL=1